MAKGHYDGNGFWVYGEDDFADEGQGFSDVLNKSADSVRAAVPVLVYNRVKDELNSDPTIREAAIDMITDELADRDIAEFGHGDNTDIAGGLRGENGRATDIALTKGGAIVDSTMDRWAPRLAARGLVGGGRHETDVAAGGIVGENKRPTDIMFNADGSLTSGSLARIAPRLGPVIAPYLPTTPNLIDTALDGSRNLRVGGLALVSRADQLAVFGDSLSDGWPRPPFAVDRSDSWPGKLDAGWAGTVYNGGIQGQSADEIAIRQGGYTLTVAGVTIPESGAVAVTCQQVFGWRLDRPFSCVGTLGGVPGTLARNGSDLTFTRAASGAAVTVASGTAFVSTAGEDSREAVQVIFAGRNDIGYASPAGNVVDRVVAATVAMVERPGVKHRRTLLVGTTTATNELRGTDGYNQVYAINSTLAAIYPHLWFDLRGYLATQAIFDLGITPTAADTTAMNGDTLPPSIMVDSIHYTPATAARVAARIKQQLNVKEWII